MKRKININRPEISSEEIAKRKNFDSVLKNNAGISGKSLLKKPWFLSSVIVATIAVIITVALLNQHPAADQQNKNDQLATAKDSIALEAFYKSEEAKPCISPPLKGLDVPYTTYKVTAEKGGTLDFKTGSKLIIPKNAFVDEKGNLLKGEIELRYREFHDAVDFFVSGIPMTYDSAGVKYQFESAGMMEMLAYQNGKQVNMAPEKSINVSLASNYNGTEYNLYKLDTMRNNWSCLGKDKVVASADKSSSSTKNNEPVTIQQTPEYKTIETKKVEVEKVKDVQIAALPAVIPEPKKPDQVKKGKYTFNIDVDTKDYPELAVYKGLLFEVGDENKNFSKALYDVIWDEAIIKEGTKKGENYLLSLKKAAQKVDLIVYPVFEGKNYETAMKEYQDKFNKYTAVLDKRKADEKRIEDDYQMQLATLRKQQADLEEEWKQKQADQFKRLSTEEKVNRVFVISSFGVYNCDNPSAYPHGILCTANLKGEKNRNLRCYGAYLVDKQKNGLFTYSRNPITSFSFDPKSINMLWTVEDGVLYWLKPEEFNSIKSSEEMRDLKLTRIDQKFNSVEELKTYFNL